MGLEVGYRIVQDFLILDHFLSFVYQTTLFYNIYLLLFTYFSSINMDTSLIKDRDS
jgi:hypothetical protein